MTERRVYTFLAPQPLARTVIVWIWIYFAAVVLSGLSALLDMRQLASGGTVDEESLITLGLDLFYLISFAVSGFFVLKWTYRVSRNAHSFALDLQVSPAWAVGWYFVPLGCLWLPFRALREAWQASAEPDRWKHVPVPARLRWWWGLWIATNFLGQISFRQTAATDPSAVALVEILSSLVDAPLCIILVGIVGDLTRMQTREAANRETTALMV